MSYPTLDKVQNQITRKVEFSNLYNKEGLYAHQEFVRRYLSPYTPYKGILLFHTLGSGKSLICISIAVDHYLHDKKRCLIITKGNSGTESFKKQIDLYYDMAKLDISRFEYNKIFVMDHYMSLHNSLRRMSDSAIISRYSHHVLVFDEIHNVRKLGSNINISNRVYGSLNRITKLPKDTKVLLVTATPMTNDIEQLESTIQLLTDKDDDTRFDGIVSFNSEIKHKPKQIFHGQYGFLRTMKVYPSYMIAHQRQYHILEEKKGVPDDIYRTLTHISLFCFPNGVYGRNIFHQGIMYHHKQERRITSMKTGTSRIIKYTSYHVRDEYFKYLTGKNLAKCSSKYYKLMEILPKAKGPVFIFIEEVKGSGLLLLANILEAHGYELYTGDHLDTIRPRKRYTFCVGDQSLVPNKSDRLEGFNHARNSNGEYVNILLGSKIIGESITLFNVRMFHVMTIHWNDSTVEQAIGRVIRSGSHDGLPPEDRTVDIYIHAALHEDGGTDLHKLNICNKKQELITKMENLLISKAIDKHMRDEKSIKWNKLDPSTFILYYMDRFNDYLTKILESSLSKLRIRSQLVKIKHIVSSMGKDYSIHPEIAMEAIYRSVTNNKRIFGKYLRESNGKLHLVGDPSRPFFLVHSGHDWIPQDETTVSPKPEIPEFDTKTFKIFRKLSITDKVVMLRNMYYLDRISFVENIIKDELDKDVETMFGALFMIYKGNKYHIMCYRIPGDAYTAVLPIPKPNTLQHKTRVLENGKWRYMDILDSYLEQTIIQKMEERHDRSMNRIDRKEDVFLIISLIDNLGRLRTRIFETTDKGDKDKRFIRKGRCLSSILKLDLALLCAYISTHVVGIKYNIGHNTDAYASKDTHAIIYGYKSMKDMRKKNPEMFDAFVETMSKSRINDIVQIIETMMVGIGKYIFL